MSSETVIHDEPVTRRSYRRQPRVEMTPEAAQHFSTWLKTHRRRLKLTQPALARQAGVSKQYISLLEGSRKPGTDRNPVTPSMRIVDKIAQALGVSPQEHDKARRLAGYVTVEDTLFLPLTNPHPTLTEDEKHLAARQSLEVMKMELNRVMKLLKESAPEEQASADQNALSAPSTPSA